MNKQPHESRLKARIAIAPLESGTIAWAIVLLLNLVHLPVQAASQSPIAEPTEKAPKSTAPIRPRVACPNEVKPLTAALLKDLPQYINRLSHQRGGSQAGKYALVASQPNLEPLPVVTNTPNPEQGGLYQVFFTVLERQYDTRQQTNSQNYYWLFLAHNQPTGWQLAILYTRRGAYPASNQEPSALRDATQEVPGLAVRQWLRDCNVGSIQISYKQR